MPELFYLFHLTSRESVRTQARLGGFVPTYSTYLVYMPYPLYSAQLNYLPLSTYVPTLPVVGGSVTSFPGSYLYLRITRYLVSGKGNNKVIDQQIASVSVMPARYVNVNVNSIGPLFRPRFCKFEFHWGTALHSPSLGGIISGNVRSCELDFSPGLPDSHILDWNPHSSTVPAPQIMAIRYYTNPTCLDPGRFRFGSGSILPSPMPYVPHHPLCQ